LKRLTTHISEAEALEELEEGVLGNLVRTTSVLANANASRKHGDTAVKHLKNVSSILTKPIPQNSDTTDARLERIEKSLEQMAMAMVASRFQIGATAAIATSSALLADSATKAIKKKR
jgi:hypothetical protein